MHTRIHIYTHTIISCNKKGRPKRQSVKSLRETASWSMTRFLGVSHATASTGLSSIWTATLCF